MREPSMIPFFFHHLFNLLIEEVLKLCVERLAEYLWKRIALTSQTKKSNDVFPCGDRSVLSVCNSHQLRGMS